jgi:phosphatidylinositol N-acetylglucosaminyltransferase subunit A
VYYLHRLPFYSQCTFPTIFGSFRILRVICLRESVTVVHAHAAFSALGLEAMLHARTLGYKVCPSPDRLLSWYSTEVLIPFKLSLGIKPEVPVLYKGFELVAVSQESVNISWST